MFAPASQRHLILLGVLLMSAACATSGPKALLGEKFAPLSGLLVSREVTVVPIGHVQTQLWGESVAATAYEVTAPASVQIACYGTTSAEFAKKQASYQVRVTPDPELRFRTFFLREIYDYWREKPRSDLEAYEHLPADKSVIEKNGRYVFFIKPDHEQSGATYLFYANHKVFEIELRSVEGGGWGPLSALIAEHLAFHEESETIDQIYFEPKYPPLKLIALYENHSLR